MPWISGRERNPARKQETWRRIVTVFAVLCAAVLVLSALYLSGAPADKRLSVYSVAANYALPLVQREGRDYVGLLELLEPLGPVTARADGSKWRIRYNSSVEGDFQVGKNHAQIMGRDADLGGKFLMESNRGLVPVASLGSLLPRFLGGPVTLHEEAGRLFIGSIATHFTASLAGENPPRLVFHFTAPVNPIIATEPGSLRMTFSREPLVSPASPTLTFGNKTMPSASFSEGNGAAAITVNASVSVMATFSSDGRTITIAPTTVTVQNIPPANPSSAAPTATAPAQAQPATPVQAPTVPRRYFAVVDASHGGDDHGETLSTTLMEKDITVALARSLRQELESRGITTLVLRDSDANLPVDQRAVFANADHAAIYVALHAASFGHGVRVYTAMLPYGGDDRGPFRSWTTAQHASLPLSQTIAGLVTSELQRRQIPVRDVAAPLRPLNNITGPAIAVEVAPQGSDVSQLTAPDYQQLVTSAVATAIVNARDQLGAAP